MIQYIAIGMIGTGLWMAYEIYRAPMMDDNGKITKDGNKFSDYLRKKIKRNSYGCSNYRQFHKIIKKVDVA